MNSPGSGWFIGSFFQFTDHLLSILWIMIGLRERMQDSLLSFFEIGTGMGFAYLDGTRVQKWPQNCNSTGDNDVQRI